ncbi:hypothetical protein LDENG_00025960 [Lucifuga dentata]|nr:hypothetical protein LDENG_00025960 [Lucifuga dentata]
MDFPCKLELLLISLWIYVCCVPGIHSKNAPGSHLSMEDVLLLKDEDDPKCFTRTEYDFTCFFETPDNRTYDLFYKTDNSAPMEKRCNMSVQRTEKGTFLHVCSFPESDIYLFAITLLQVVETSTNTTLYLRNVCVEDQVLLDPPFNVSLRHTGRAGELQVAWHMQVAKGWEKTVHYRIRYSSELLGEKIKEGQGVQVHKLVSLVPGEVVQVQVRVKRAYSENEGHWSHWSHPMLTTAPQRADDVSLLCYTSDLQNITCQWNPYKYKEFAYKLFYKMSISQASDWRECRADRNWTDLCRFHGDESRVIQVKLSNSSAPAPLSRTFYSEPFTLNNSIRTSPPGHVRGAVERGKLCLTWKAPLLELLTHLQYEICYQTRGDGAWMTVSLKGPETETCLEVPTGSQYRVKIRAKPNGSIYSGHWSEWSHVLSRDVPTDISALLVLCVPVTMLILAVVLIILFPMYLRKLKQYLWPPVPNLDKVLQGFLTEFNGQRWNPPITAKQSPEETTASVVEVMSEDEASMAGKLSEESTQLLSESSGDQVSGSPRIKPEVHPDYVTLSKDSVILCPKGNKYVYEKDEEKGSSGVKAEILQTKYDCFCTDKLACFPSCSCTDFLNHSYLPLAEPVDRRDFAVRGPGNLYTNVPQEKATG